MPSPINQYKRNHYVPQWYQHRFIPADNAERKFYYLDLLPDKIEGTNKWRKDLLNWGPKSCFYEDDLYTVRYQGFENIDIEKYFFGDIDRQGERALDYFDTFEHPGADGDAFRAFLNYMSIQKLRTPKGLAHLAELNKSGTRNSNLIFMQRVQNMYCATWTECVWQIADASQSNTKFIISDHPVTVYNRACFPQSDHCKGTRDPDIRLAATQTIFPLSLNKIIILTNLSWLRNPYQSELRVRPNPKLFRTAMFNFMEIQTHRYLSEYEVQEINFIIKNRAQRYIAAGKKEWLYPEKQLKNQNWRKLGKGYLLMPDPRPQSMGGEIMVGYKDGSSEAFNEYGQRPWQSGYKNEERENIERKTLYKFKGEFAHLFGPQRRGRQYTVGRLDKEEDDSDYHQYHLNYFKRTKQRRKGTRRSR